MEEALREYGGGTLVISHDRQFLEAVTDRVVYLADGRLRVFDGGLAQCLQVLGEERQQKRAAKAEIRPRAKTGPGHGSRTEARSGARSGDASKIRNPFMFKKLEEEIFAMEERLETLRQDMVKPEHYNDHRSMQRLQQEEQELLQELRSAYERWENWS